ncbi:MAG: GHKL domain-containing protein [Defluviitaleaceae bacterium]|nr:GHKL domain-containing protein [Defluviitaleaceae bacterium]
MAYFVILLASLASVVIYVVALINIGKFKVRIWEAILAVLMMLLSAVVLFAVFSDALVELAAIIGNIFTIAVLTILAYIKTKILQLSIFYSIATVIIILFGANLATQILLMTGLIPSLHTRYYVDNDAILSAISVILILTFSFIASRYAGKFIEKATDTFDTDLQKRFARYMIGGSSITLVLYFIHTFARFLIFSDAILGILYTLTLMAYLSFLAFAIYAFTDNFKKDMEAKHQNEMLENLQAYTARIEEAFDGLAKFKHDHRNLLFTFHEHLKSGNIEKLKNAFETYIGYSAGIMDDNELDLKNLSFIEIPELKGLLMFKLLRAIQQNIAVSVEISEKVGNADSDCVLDLCRIMGILFDNAVEACLESSRPELRFVALNEDNVLTFLLYNSYENVPQLDSMFEKGYSTKGEGRGTGLHTAAQILDENKMISLKVSVKDGLFENEVYVYD